MTSAVMADHVVDTNVLLVASAADPHSPFTDTHVPPTEQKSVFEWLQAFRANTQRRLVLDEGWGIFGEYRKRLTAQDYGLQVAVEKLQQARYVAIERDSNGDAVVPAAFSRFDRSDRQLLAAALSDPTRISIVNACDSDWLEIETELASAGVTIEHIIELWLRESVRRSR
jgi:hypothetical protein